MKTLEDYIVSIPDFPRPGILFRDVTGVLDSGEGLRLAVEALAERLQGLEFDAIAGVESRGFLFGAPLAYHLGKGFIPVRKPGKLPRAVVRQSYDLEYGSATVEMHADAIKPGQRVVVLDDLLATGGTAKAAATLVERLGGAVVKMLFLVELFDLGAREGKLSGYDVDAILRFPGH
ncbi:MAG: adenine phosphoribosyltransferase [Kiritimatiellae bacterium]|nr:adenine phosphoribosyltransferase [Kiritimatiellia bacterium]